MLNFEVRHFLIPQLNSRLNPGNMPMTQYIYLYVVIGIKAKPVHTSVSVDKKEKKRVLRPQVSVLVSLHSVWVYVHVTLYKSGTLSVSPLQIVCLPLSPP